MSDDAAAPSGPVLRVVRGAPGDEDLAALVAVLAARAGGASASADGSPRSQWNERSRLVRRPLTPGPGAWRASALPR